MQLSEPRDRESREARLWYRTLRQSRRSCVLEIRLETGRKHQIRLQLASRGYPILGDRKYGSRSPFRPGIALHSRKLALQHPVRKDRLEIVAAVPDAWNALGIADD